MMMFQILLEDIAAELLAETCNQSDVLSNKLSNIQARITLQKIACMGHRSF